jgi:peptidoglycan/xylan/chitin deacetylase (PgdA/CDA1 family)
MRAVREMLRVFQEYDVNATWATVGFLFLNGAEDLKSNIPYLTPKYVREEFCPYKYLEKNNLEPRYHFAPDLIQLIKRQGGQEIGSHTFSHYYCLEEGQSADHFESDLSLAVQIAKRYGISIKSLVFPRNETNPEYFPILLRLGVKCYRGNQNSWLYKASTEDQQTYIARGLRLADAYFNLTGHNTYGLESCVHSKPFNFPASFFLRPYSAKLARLDWFRLKRIKDSMTYAALNNHVFHLWWHPHNFGSNIDKNILFLQKILSHYRFLHESSGMTSLNMGELCSLVEKRYEERRL